MDFVLQPHIVNARLNIERGEMKTYAGLHITGFLRSQIECRRHAVFRCDHTDTIIHVRDTEALRDAAEDGELLVEPVLRAKVECAIELALVQWNAGLITKAAERWETHQRIGAGRIWVEGVGRPNACLLHTGPG